MRFVRLSWITTRPGRAWVGSVSNKHNPSTKSGLGACISSRITTVIHVVNDHQINYNCFNEPFAVSPYRSLYWDMHGLIFETSIWLLAGSTRFVGRQLILCKTQLHSRSGAAPDEQAIRPEENSKMHRQSAGVWPARSWRQERRVAFQHCHARLVLGLWKSLRFSLTIKNKTMPRREAHSFWKGSQKTLTRCISNTTSTEDTTIQEQRSINSFAQDNTLVCRTDRKDHTSG